MEFTSKFASLDICGINDVCSVELLMEYVNIPIFLDGIVMNIEESNIGQLDKLISLKSILISLLPCKFQWEQRVYYAIYDNHICAL